MSATYSGRLRSCARLLAFGLVLTAAGCTSLIGSRGQQGTAPISPSAPPPRAADQKFAEILATFAMGLIADMQQDPDAVLTNCLKLIRLDPDNSPTYLRAALAYLQKKQPEQAISILQRLQHRKPRDPLPYIYLGILYETMDRSPEARRAYLKAVRLGSNDPVPYQRLASAYLDRGEHKRAVDVLKQGLARVRRKEPLLRSLAEIYLYQAQKATTPDDRRNALRQVIPVLQELTATTESHELSPFWQLAGAYADLGRYADALQVLRRTADLIRSDLIASEAVARWITTRDDRDKFIALMEKRLEDEPGDHLTRVWLAAVYRNVGEDEKALGCYEAALATSNAPEVAYTEMGRLLIQKHDSRAAE
ncbi:MAG TPA: tetratricopeptide repeat protein, partial [Lentisphaerae bacterium]|nr:tetratricopeptide repeat protein [Lentisphaerota bacterium]